MADPEISAAPEIRIEQVSSKRDIKRFIRLAKAIYKDDPQWVEPLEMERLDLLLAKKNPWFEHAEARFWIAHKEGQPVGRISAQVCQLVESEIEEGLGQFGMFECIEDKAVADALFKTAEDWLRSKGMKRVQGPFSLSVNTECGLLVSGFETPPSIMMGHARPYYEDLVLGQGYAREKEMYAYLLYIGGGMNELVNNMKVLGERNKSLEMRRIDMKNYEREVATFFDIYNEAWSGNWGFLPFTESESRHAAKSMRPLIRDFMTHVCYHHGEPVAFMITLPDINRVLHQMNGRLLPFGWFKLVRWLFKRESVHVRVPLMGVRKKYQGTRLGAVMALWLIDVCQRGCAEHKGAWGELSWILEDNLGMRKILEQTGCDISKTYRIYDKSLL